MKVFLMACLALLAAGWIQAGGMLDTTPETRLGEADRLARAGQVDEALAEYRRLAGTPAEDAALYARMGGMQLMKQDYSGAIESFQTAIGLDGSGNGEAFIGLGIAYLHLGKYGPARAALTEARRIKPEAAADLDHLVVWLDARGANPEIGRY